MARGLDEIDRHNTGRRQRQYKNKTPECRGQSAWMVMIRMISDGRAG